MPSISIIIANYNHSKFIQECCNSLLNQSYEDWEAIIVDDASTDDSVSVINNLTKKDARFKFYQNEHNLGYQKTLVRAISLSNAPLFGILDPDDILTDNALELSFNMHCLHPEVGLVYSNIIFCDHDLKPFKYHKTKQVDDYSMDYYLFNAEISKFSTIKRKFFDKTSGIDINNRRAEDKDIYMKLFEIAPVKHLDEYLYLYRHHGNSASTYANANYAIFWHWVALIKMAERRNINIEELFFEHFKRIDSNQSNLIKVFKNSKWIKLGQKLGIIRNINLD
jgi:glycosyltransferase involved in cell wall biosynthesis